MAVYDEEKQDEQPRAHHDDLGTPEERREAEAEEWEKRYRAPSASESLAHREGLSDLSSKEEDEGIKKSNPEALRKAEAAGAGGVADSGSADAENESIDSNNDTFYREEDGGKSKGKRRVHAKGILKKRNLLMAGGIGGITALIIALFVSLIPLKIEHIVANLENHFMSSSTQAVENESQNLLKGYVCNLLTGKNTCVGTKGCVSTIDKDCKVTVSGNDPVSNLFRSWSNNKFEQKLYNDYGVEFSRSGSTLELKVNGESKVVDLGTNGTRFSQVLSRSEYRDIRATVLSSMDGTTQWKKIMIRFKLGRLLEEKYHITRCEFFCNIQKKLNLPAQQVNNAAKEFIAKRVIGQVSDTESQAIKCIIDNCDPTADSNKDQPCTAGNNCETNDAPQSKDFDEPVGEALAADAGGAETAEELASALAKYEGSDFNTKIVQIIVQKITGQAAPDAIPIVGQILAAAQLINQLTEYAHQGANIATSLKHLSYVTHAVGAVSTYMLFRSLADEMKTGNVDPAGYGSFVNSLGPNGDCDSASISSGQCAGGTSSAEEAPMYDATVSSNSATDTTTGSLFADLFSPKVSAAAAAVTYSHTSSTTQDYQCNGYTPTQPKPVPNDLQVCPEEQFGAINFGGLIGDVQSVLSNPAISTLVTIWNHTPIKGILTAINSISTVAVDAAFLPCSLPFHLGDDLPICQLKKALSSSIGFVLNKLVGVLVPVPISNNMSGGRTFDVMAAGADASASDFGQESIGGKRLNPTQTASAINEQQQEQMTSFEQQPFFAKIFSVNSQYSLVSRIAMDLPIGNASYVTQSSIGSILGNPLSKIVDSFGSIFARGGSAFADASAAPDAWNIAQYGYPDSSTFTNAPPGKAVQQISDKNSPYYNPNYSKISQADADSDPSAYWQKYCASPSNPDQINQAVLNGYNDTAQLDPTTGMYENTSTDPCQLIQVTTGSNGAYTCPSMLTQDDLADSPPATSNCNSSGQTANNVVAQEINSENVTSAGYFKNAFVSEGRNTSNSMARVFDDVLSPLREIL